MQTVTWKVFEYGETELMHLRKVDPVLGVVIAHLGPIERMIIPDLFSALVFAFVGQLISVKASHIIFARMQETLGEISPENITKISVETIKSCGISMKKAIYIKEIATSIVRGELNLNDLYQMSDEKVIKTLCALDGVGKWTAEMLLLNSMERKNILSFGDIAILRGLCKLYGKTEISKKEFDQYKARYSPYCSVASIYLWRYSSKEQEVIEIDPDLQASL